MSLSTDTITSRERLLLALAGVFVALNQAALVAARGDSWLMIWPALVWSVCAAAGHRVLSRRLPARDPFIFPVVMLLTGWGLSLVDRLAPAFAARQVLWAAFGVIALIVVISRPRILRLLRRYPYTWLVLGTSLLMFTVIFGVNPTGYGARLWLNVLGLGYFQPSEVLKILLVVYLASYLAAHGDRLRTETVRLGPARVPSPAVMGPLLTMWGISCVVLVWQRDLGTAALFLLVFLAMLYVATGQRSYVLAGLGLLAIAVLAAYFLFDVVKLRVDIWLNPWPESQGRAYQIVQSLLAFAAGGVIGEGAGLGAPGYIPVVHSDFVFAALAEEWGLAGALAVVGCFGLLATRGLRIAACHAEAERRFNALLAAGLSATLAAQALLIMGGVLKIVPLTGVTLPFVSYGGSSLLGSFVLVGLLLLLSGPSPPEPAPEPLARKAGRLVRRLTKHL
ncbi:MAG: FtsW/RodA/SpoVE family cell cycle protein [Anaerolineae bacterium]|nr:FtsW/RodA/SpoVE family cell cycle protein [Anaerolineae bacterium]